MKRITGLAAGVMATFLMVGPGFAAESVRDSTSAEKSGKLAMPGHVLDTYLHKDGMVGNDDALGDRKAALTGAHLNSVIGDT